MREIKFRFWDGKSMTQNYTLEKLMAEAGNVRFDLGDEIMQYTGIKDRNGKEIYEGDILKSSYTEFGHEVAFKNVAFYIKHNAVCCPPYKTSLTEAKNWQEIIGNIYENPELIK